MTTKCYAQVRGSAVRVTGLDRCGQLLDGGSPYAVSRSVAKITINEISDGGGHELLRTPEDEPRLHLVKNAETIRYTADVEFLRVDPGIINLVTGLPTVLNAAGEIAGFDADTRIPAQSFAMEVWSKIAGGDACNTTEATVMVGFGHGPFGHRPFGHGETVEVTGSRQYGYTLFPWLKGGVLSGFTFANGLVSFNLLGAKIQKGTNWGVGPYPTTMHGGVSRNTQWRNILTIDAPPAQTNGVA